MRTGIENWLLHHWYGNHQPPWYLRMLEPLYRTGFERAQTKGKKALGSYRQPLPLVVVGNITAGGSGKTPLVISLCRLVSGMNFRPGIVSTGYRRQGNDALVVTADSDPEMCGDEPVLLAKRTGVPVVVAARRDIAVKMLHGMDVDLVISDDGLQQADLPRDVDICVVDGARGTGNGHLLPAGPLREGVERLALVDHVVSNGEWIAKPDGLMTSVMTLEGTTVNSIDDAKSLTIDEFREYPVHESLHAVAAIGNPERFFAMLESLGFELARHPFADHHLFRRQDFSTIPDNARIIMTEKDAVKCRGLGLENAWYLPVDAILPDEFNHWFCEKVNSLIGNRT